jgi:hypothetical protein
MKHLTRLEELGMLALSVALFSALEYRWWWYPALILLPDISMAGYMFGTKAGARIYNLFHHKGTAILIYLLGLYAGSPPLQLAGIILFGHASMDRIFGYGLKYEDSFKHTHLGWIGGAESRKQGDRNGFF